MKKSKTMKRKRGRLVRELWVGFTHACLHWARIADCHRAQIVNQSSQARGFRGPLVVHLCGQYTAVRDWPDIFAALKAVEAYGDKVEWCEHDDGAQRQNPAEGAP